MTTLGDAPKRTAPRSTSPSLDPAGPHSLAVRRRRWRTVAWAQLAVLAIIGVGVLFLPAPFLLHHPGLVIDATGHLNGPAVTDPGFGQGGRFLLTTQRTTPLTWGGYTWFLVMPVPDGGRVVPIPAAAPRSHYVSLAAMDQSKDIATAVAGCAVVGCTPQPVGVRIVGATGGSPAADGGLRPGDVIVAATLLPTPRAYADATTPAATSLASILRTLHVAEQAAATTGQRKIRLDVVRDGQIVTLTVTPDGGPLGADLVTAYVAQRVSEVDTGRVGGPSTGLMLTLTLIDAMTTGDLAGGKRVAGTGTIAADGTVGPIGGVPAKVVGAVRAGAQVFLVPPINAEEARRAAPPWMTVVEVRTLADALRWLCVAGGAAPACDPGRPRLTLR